MEIHIIWAQDNNSGIGKNHKLPWHIPEDLKNFKNITKNNTIIMGRKTWDSLPIKPLPFRKNIVLSRKKIKDVECYNSVDNCLSAIQLEKDVFIIIFVMRNNYFYSIYREGDVKFSFIVCSSKIK